MRNEMYAALLALGYACSSGLQPEHDSAEGDDIVTDQRVMIIDQYGRGDFSDCQSAAADLADRLGSYGVAVRSATDVSGQSATPAAEFCDIEIVYTGAQKYELVTFGDDDWDSWLSGWNFSGPEECEAERPNQQLLFGQAMNALILSDRCYAGGRRQIPFQAYEIRAVVPVPAPAKVLKFSFPEDLQPVWSAIEKELASVQATVFRDWRDGDDRIALAYVSRDVQVTHFGRAAFNWYESAFVSEDDCRQTLNRIAQILTDRFAGAALASDCIVGGEGFQPQLFYASKQGQLGQMGTRPEDWYQTMAECAAAVAAADAQTNAASPALLSFCLQEAQGSRRFVMAYFAMP